MPSKHQWEDANVLAHLRAVFDTPVLIHVRTTILVHERSKKKVPCPCCGSPEVRIAKRMKDLDLLIDRVSGERRLRSRIKDKAGFDALAAGARLIEIPIRCYESQLRLILDSESKIIAALAGNKAGKSTAGAYWMVRQWMLRGGKGAVLWWVAPQRSQTAIAIKKLVTGEWTKHFHPPAFPLDDFGRPILVVKWPESDGARDQRLVMLDGTKIELQHAGKTGDNLKGANVAAILVDETCAIRHRSNWTVLVARLMESGGQLYSSTTPKAGHWLKEVVVGQAKENPDIRVVNLSSRDNPWVSPEEIERTIRAAHDEGEAMREIDGQWVSDEGNLWAYWDPRRMTVDDHSYNCLRDETDVTAQAVRDWWKNDNPYVRGVRTHQPKFVVGMDCNVNPMTAVICKIFGTPGKPETWGIYVVDVVQKYRVETWQFGNYLKDCRRGAVLYEGIPIALDPTACSWDPTMTRISAIKYGKNAGKTLAELGFDARPANLSKRGYACGISRHATTGLLQKMMREGRLIVNATRCQALTRAFEEQQRDGNGVAVKVSHTASDKLSSPVDALAYLAWAIFQKEESGARRGKIEVM